MTFIFPAPPTPSAAIAGENARFPVRRIFCVGRNYAAHVREMGGDPKSEPPLIFTKPADAIVEQGTAIAYPPETADFHYEIELVAAIGKGGRAIAPENALGHVYGYAVGIDFTRRDSQAVASNAGAPWDHSKAFDQSAPLGPITPASRAGHPKAARIWLAVNGALRQDSDIANMIWSVTDIVATLSRGWALAPGDLIFTGTPNGIGPVVRGDVITGGVDGFGEIRFEIV